MEENISMDDNERASLQLQIDNLKSVNSELVDAVQHLKLSLKQKSTDNLELQRELNHLRLKLCRIQSSGTAQARALGAAVQSNIGDAVSNLVQASNVLATTLELTKNYIRERQELETASPRWSNLSSPRTNEKLNKVRPLSVGGHNIQPVVALSRMPISANISNMSIRSPTQNATRERTALPMHLLQDLYIPLMRIDSSEFLQNNEEEDVNEDDSVDNLGLNESHNDIVENMDSILVDDDDDDIETGRTLNEIQEDIEPEDEADPPRQQIENPMEGPSWLLDVSTTSLPAKSKSRMSEPDSTTEYDEPKSPEVIPETPQPAPQLSVTSRAFTPTMRRRKRPSSPTSPQSTPTPRLSEHRLSKRVLKVMVPKIRVRKSIAGDDVAPREPDVTPSEPDVTPSEPDVTPSEHNVTDDRENYVTDSKPLLKRKVSKVRAEHSDVTRNTKPTHSQQDEDEDTDSKRFVKPKVSKSRAEESDAGGDRASQPSTSYQQEGDPHRRSRRTLNTSDDVSDTSRGSCDQHDAKRVRRARKTVVYKEKPLNRKLRR